MSKARTSQRVHPIPKRNARSAGSEASSVHRSAGSTLMEMLAALLVIAVGIIGVAALYSDTVHVDEEVQLHTRAEQLAAEMAKLIQSTAEGREGYAGTVGVLCNAKRTLKLPQDVAANAAACWQDRVEAALPSGLGTITRDTSTTPVRYVVAVSWSAPEKGAASYVIQVTPK